VIGLIECLYEDRKNHIEHKQKVVEFVTFVTFKSIIA